MQIELSPQASAKIAAAIGSADEQTVNRLVERMADDDQLMQSLMMDDLTADDVQAVREGLESWKADRVRSFAEFDAEFRDRNGLPPRP
jgi:hypothetical protein